MGIDILCHIYQEFTGEIQKEIRQLERTGGFSGMETAWVSYSTGKLGFCHAQMRRALGKSGPSVTDV